MQYRSAWQMVLGKGGARVCLLVSARSGWLSVPCPDLKFAVVMGFE